MKRFLWFLLRFYDNMNKSITDGEENMLLALKGQEPPQPFPSPYKENGREEKINYRPIRILLNVSEVFKNVYIVKSLICLKCLKVGFRNINAALTKISILKMHFSWQKRCYQPMRRLIYQKLLTASVMIYLQLNLMSMD